MGMPGAGKSRLAVELGRDLGVPVVHLDSLYWKPGWVASEWDEFRAEHDRVIAQEAWVLDGNYSRGGLEERLKRADTVYVLMVPRPLAMARVVRRWLRHRGTTRPDLGDGKPEKLDAEFVRWVWQWERNHPDFIERVRRNARGRVIVRYRGKRRFIR
jgi:adenylate kinase family enzyme